MERVNLQGHPHLQELELADSAESPDSIDILIGSDHYWDFVTGETIQGDFGPTAVRSKQVASFWTHQHNQHKRG